MDRNAQRAPHRGALLWLRAETSIHVGQGQQSGLIDQPFAREGGTGYPYIPGSGMKGALRDALRLTFAPSNSGESQTDMFFGTQEQAGPVLVSDARLAFLPVRSLSAPYRYLTCPHLLARLRRDLDFVMSPGGQASAAVTEGHYRGGPAATEPLFLEEFPFQHAGDVDLSPVLQGLPQSVADTVRSRVAVICDDDFYYFAQHSLHVRTRNALDPISKTAANTALWSEESLPPDTIMTAVLVPRLQSHAGILHELLATYDKYLGGYFQVGANETVGEGWFGIVNLSEILTPAAGASA